MNSKDLQIKTLEEIFRTPSYAPIFKQNPHYCINRFSDLTPYISFKDLLNNKILIRGCPIGRGNFVDLGSREIIVEYDTIEELVNDGWILD